MKFGYNMFPLMGLTPREMVRVAKLTDELGYESIWMPDHFIFPPEIPPTYPFSEDGTTPWKPDTALYEPFVLLASLAAVTTNLKLGVHVLLVPLRDTINTARAVATLDLFSEGRAILGAGLGWLKDEYDISDRDWSTRGATLSEQIEAIKLLWTAPVTEYNGKHVRIAPCVFEPKPYRKPHPPVHVGGLNPAALRRAARLADGWTGVVHGLDETKGIIEELRRLRAEYGRETAPFEITVMYFGHSVEEVRAFEEAGVHRLLINPVTGPASTRTAPTEQSLMDGLRLFAEEVASKL